ncbi:MAG: DNA topoisomerase III [Verrucomicrobia bacterium]|jgi:DNA topoisomerase-3|nr:DNA topoisomerase III [Verrucomicrobiota bacterium]
MGKALIIAEKPSVAADIAKALGGLKRDKDFFEGDRYVVASAVGHLLELAVPDGVEAKRGKWTFAHLPVIPHQFDIRPIEKAESRLKLLTKLIQRKDVAEIINACDAGREGELIFRNIVRHSRTQKPLKRLWLQSMTPAAIREGFQRLREDSEMLPLADAAVSRSEADWLVGINGTRAMTAFNSKAGGFFLTTVGRVQTPTLAILVEREKRIKDFKPRNYWELHATFEAEAGEYVGRWFDEGFRKQEGDPDLKSERLWDEQRAQAIRDRCVGRPGVVTEESKPSTQLSPLLYDLTSLQREANARFGLSANQTLSITQALYERHKVVTYPRTDSRALPEDYLGTVRQTLEMLRDTAYGPFAASVLESGWVKPNKRIFNNAKVSDHFAIIPTPQPGRGLKEIEAKVYDMIARRFLAVFHPAAEYLVTTRITRVEGEPFKTDGKVMLKPGWLAVYGREAQSEDATPMLAPVKPDEQVQTREVRVEAAQTKPPPRFSEATLLGAMEGAGKLVDDEELRAAMSEKGLGTPATRAAIIEGLIRETYIHRAGRELQPTPKAFMLMELLHGLGVSELTKPELTGTWEHKLNEMQRGRLPRQEFMRQIEEMTRHIVEKARSHEKDTIAGDFGTLRVPCPKCGGEVHERYEKFACQSPGCDFSIRRIFASRLLDLEEAERLIRDRQIGPLQGFRSKLGRPFAAVLRLSPEYKVDFDFGNEPREGEGEVVQVDFSSQEPLGACPKCGARVFELPMRYVCEKTVTKECDFSTGKIILQQPVDRAQVMKLLGTGRTDLFPKFISRKGRPFKAFLVLDNGKVGFEFEKREPRAKSTSAKEKAPAEKLDFTGQEPLGKCPRCGGRVFESASSYVCEQSQAEKKPCKFKSGKVILEQPLDRAQMAKLLAEAKSDLLAEFVSRRGNKFKAWLVMDDKGKVTFEFPEREER